MLVVGTLAPGLGPKDVEKTITWRIEKYVSRHARASTTCESVSRNNLSIVYVWLKWGTDLNAAQTLVQQQVAFAMAAVPKTLGVAAALRAAVRPVERAGGAGGGLGRRAHRARSSTTTRSTTSSRCWRASPAWRAPRPTAAGSGRSTWCRPGRGAGARRHLDRDRARRCAQANALLPSGGFVSPRFDANVYTNAVPAQVETIGDAIGEACTTGQAGRRSATWPGWRTAARPETQSVSIDGKDAGLPQRAAGAGRQHPGDRRRGEGTPRQRSRACPRAWR